MQSAVPKLLIYYFAWEHRDIADVEHGFLSVASLFRTFDIQQGRCQGVRKSGIVICAKIFSRFNDFCDI